MLEQTPSLKIFTVSGNVIPTPFHIRWLIRRDFPECLVAEWIGSKRQSWTENDFSLHMKMRDHIGMVVEHGEEVIAHFIYQLHKKTLSIKRLVVHPDWRRMGAGTAILNKLKSKLYPHGQRHKLKIITSDGDLALNLLLKKNEFTPIKHLKGCILWVYTKPS